MTGGADGAVCGGELCMTGAGESKKSFNVFAVSFGTGGGSFEAI